MFSLTQSITSNKHWDCTLAIHSSERPWGWFYVGRTSRSFWVGSIDRLSQVISLLWWRISEWGHSQRWVEEVTSQHLYKPQAAFPPFSLQHLVICNLYADYNSFVCFLTNQKVVEEYFSATERGKWGVGGGQLILREGCGPHLKLGWLIYFRNLFCHICVKVSVYLDCNQYKMKEKGQKTLYLWTIISLSDDIIRPACLLLSWAWRSRLSTHPVPLRRDTADPSCPLEKRLHNKSLTPL